MNWYLIKTILFPWTRRLELFGRTDTGKVRPHNEDSFALLPDQNLMMVADGMGGHNAGEVASQRAIESMISLLSQGALKNAGNNREEILHTMIQSLHRTNEAVINMGRENEKHSGMGCTFIAGYVRRNTLYTCHVGDVRGYIANHTGLRQITTDHTYAAQFEKRKKEDVHFDDTIKMPGRNIVSRAVGFPFSEDPECHSLPVKRGDRIILCSDGLWTMVDHRRMEEIISEAETPEHACDTFIDEANQAGGRDNITAVLVRL